MDSFSLYWVIFHFSTWYNAERERKRERSEEDDLHKEKKKWSIRGGEEGEGKKGREGEASLSSLLPLHFHLFHYFHTHILTHSIVTHNLFHPSTNSNYNFPFPPLQHLLNRIGDEETNSILDYYSLLSGDYIAYKMNEGDCSTRRRRGRRRRGRRGRSNNRKIEKGKRRGEIRVERRHGRFKCW